MSSEHLSGEAKVAVESRVIVSCAHSSSITSLTEPVRLGPLDQVVFPFVPIAVVFVYQHPVSQTNTNSLANPELIPLDRLQRAVERVLDYYPHLTGRLQLNKVDFAPEIGNLGKGAELLSAVCPTPLKSFYSAFEGRLVVTDLPSGGNALLAPYIPDWNVIQQKPVLTIQRTRFSCGSVCLGIRLPHLLCDGDGFFQFCRDLAEIYRKLGKNDAASLDEVQLDHLPILTPYLHDLYQMTEKERQEACKYTPWLFSLPPATPIASDESSGSHPSPPIVTGRVLRFSASELQALKSHATDKNDKSGFVTTFDALAAHLHQRVYHARKKLAKDMGNENTEVSTAFLAPVNQRSADRLNLTNRYFANAILAVFDSLPSKTLENEHLHPIASHIHNLVRKVKPEEANKTLRWISAQPNKSLILPGFRLDQSIFMASQWCKFDVYSSMDFDIVDGKKLDVTLAFPPFTTTSLVDGLTYFMATEDQLKHSPSDSSIDVAMALSHPLWQYLDQDPLLHQFR